MYSAKGKTQALIPKKISFLDSSTLLLNQSGQERGGNRYRSLVGLVGRSHLNSEAAHQLRPWLMIFIRQKSFKTISGAFRVMALATVLFCAAVVLVQLAGEVLVQLAVEVLRSGEVLVQLAGEVLRSVEVLVQLAGEVLRSGEVLLFLPVLHRFHVSQ